MFNNAAGNSSAARAFIGLEQRSEEEHASFSTEPVVNDQRLEQPNSTTISTPHVIVLRSPFYPDKTFATVEQLLRHVNKSLPKIHSRLTLEQKGDFALYLTQSMNPPGCSTPRCRPTPKFRPINHHHPRLRAVCAVYVIRKFLRLS